MGVGLQVFGAMIHAMRPTTLFIAEKLPRCSPKGTLVIVLLFTAFFGGPARTEECHPSYVGECVPIASDVDCAGGSGNGPEYIVGPVQVVGPDDYDLDRDGDGIGCD